MKPEDAPDLDMYNQCLAVIKAGIPVYIIHPLVDEPTYLKIGTRMYPSSLFINHQTDQEAVRNESEPLEDVDHIQALVNERNRLMAKNPRSTEELLTVEIAKEMLENRAAVLAKYTLVNYILVSRNPYAQFILDECYKKDRKKFPVAIGLLFPASGTLLFLPMHSSSSRITIQLCAGPWCT